MVRHARGIPGAVIHGPRDALIVSHPLSHSLSSPWTWSLRIPSTFVLTSVLSTVVSLGEPRFFLRMKVTSTVYSSRYRTVVETWIQNMSLPNDPIFKNFLRFVTTVLNIYSTVPTQKQIGVTEGFCTYNRGIIMFLVLDIYFQDEYQCCFNFVAVASKVTGCSEITLICRFTTIETKKASLKSLMQGECPSLHKKRYEICLLISV